MAENAKESGTVKETPKRRGRKKATEKVEAAETVVDKEVVTVPEAPVEPSPRARKALSTADFQESVREQIENCRAEIITELQMTIQHEISEVVVRQAQRDRRRRRWSAFFHDLIILLLAGLVGFFGYCLYDAKYFDFMKSDCERNGTCQEDQRDDTEEVGVVKDAAWYERNYRYLFDNLQIYLDPDGVDAYYLYSGDYKAGDIKPAYLLAMAYGKTLPVVNGNSIIVSESELQNSFRDLFGSLEYYERDQFIYDCLEFSFDRTNSSYVAENKTCNKTHTREVVEEIDEIYGEGSVIYILTTAAIYDTAERSFYKFDNMFRAAATGVTEDSLDDYRAVLNRYQYSFKKSDNGYRFDGIVKLQ